MNINIVKSLSAVILLFSVNYVVAQISEFDQKSVLIVRLQSDQHKIDYLKKQKGDVSAERVATVQQEKSNYNKMIIRQFNQFYDYSEVIYIYDTASVDLKNGKTTGIFLDKNLQSVENYSLKNRPYLILSENTENSSVQGLVLLNPDFSRVDHSRLDFIKLNTFFLASEERIFALAVQKLNNRMQKYLPNR